MCIPTEDSETMKRLIKNKESNVSKYKYCTCTEIEKQIGDIERSIETGLVDSGILDDIQYRLNSISELLEGLSNKD